MWPLYFQYSIGDAAFTPYRDPDTKEMLSILHWRCPWRRRRRRTASPCLTTFNTPLEMRDLRRYLETALKNTNFQYSIGDASGSLPPVLPWQHPAPFNTPLEMLGLRRDADVEVVRFSLSILHWRCRPVADDPLLPVRSLSILHWRCRALHPHPAGGRRRRLSILHWRCRMCASPPSSARAVHLSILHWRCWAGIRPIRNRPGIGLSILHWRCLLSILSFINV